jgi:hypothetical protein
MKGFDIVFCEHYDQIQNKTLIYLYLQCLNELGVGG